MPLENNKPNVVGYIRVSTNEQAEQGLSLESQENSIRKYCKNNNLNLVAVYSDNKSAKTLKRKGLTNARIYCRRHKKEVSKFIFHNLSRLTRSLENQILLLAEFKSFGIEAVSLNETIEETPLGRMMTNLVGAINQFNNETKSVDVTEKLLSGREKGQPMHMLPIGYLNKRSIDGEPYGEVDPERGHFITEIFKKMSTGMFAQNQVMVHFNSLGFTTRKGNPLSPQTLNRILTNRTYTGMLYVDEERGWRASPHIPALTEVETFDRVQGILSSRKKKYENPTRTKRSSDFPLTVFCRCDCGASFTVSYTSKQTGDELKKIKYPYYRCRSSKCGSSYRKEELESGFVSILKRLSPSTGLLRAFKLVIRDVYDEKLGDSKKEVTALEKKLEEIEKRKSKLMDLMLDGSISKHDFSGKNDELTASITDLSWTISEKRTTLIQLSSVIDSAFAALQSMDKTWLNSDTETKRLIQRALFPSGLVYTKSGEFRTPQVTKAFNILELLEMDESQVVPPPGFEPRLPAPEADALSS